MSSLDPAEVARAWEGALHRAWGMAAPIASGPEQVGRRLAGPIVAPFAVMLEAIDQTSAAMRTQAQALEAAAEAFAQASSLLDLQASLLEHAVETVRDPAAALKATGTAALGLQHDPGADG